MDFIKHTVSRLFDKGYPPCHEAEDVQACKTKLKVDTLLKNLKNSGYTEKRAKEVCAEQFGPKPCGMSEQKFTEQQLNTNPFGFVQDWLKNKAADWSYSGAKALPKQMVWVAKFPLAYVSWLGQAVADGILKGADRLGMKGRVQILYKHIGRGTNTLKIYGGVCKGYTAAQFERVNTYATAKLLGKQTETIRDRHKVDFRVSEMMVPLLLAVVFGWKAAKYFGRIGKDSYLLGKKIYPIKKACTYLENQLDRVLKKIKKPSKKFMEFRIILDFKGQPYQVDIPEPSTEDLLRRMPGNFIRSTLYGGIAVLLGQGVAHRYTQVKAEADKIPEEVIVQDEGPDGICEKSKMLTVWEKTWMCQGEW